MFLSHSPPMAAYVLAVFFPCICWIISWRGAKSKDAIMNANYFFLSLMQTVIDSKWQCLTLTRKLWAEPRTFPLYAADFVLILFWISLKNICRCSLFYQSTWSWRNHLHLILQNHIAIKKIYSLHPNCFFKLVAFDMHLDITYVKMHIKIYES
jgi:hypothetical protein